MFEREVSLRGERQDRNSRELLGDRANGKTGVWRNRPFDSNIGQAIPFRENDGAMRPHEKRETRCTAPLKTLKANLVKTGWIGGGRIGLFGLCQDGSQKKVE